MFLSTICKLVLVYLKFVLCSTYPEFFRSSSWNRW